MKSNRQEETFSSKKDDVKVNKLSDLKRMIGRIINDTNENDFPQVIHFNRGIEYRKFKVTIDEIDDDFFIDSKGSKWVKVKNESENE